jgi:hypothetical protein
VIVLQLGSESEEEVIRHNNDLILKERTE